MKKLLMGSVLLLGASIGRADTAPTPAKPGEPCKQIIQACTQAGFAKGMHEKNGKGLYKDCLDPILAGRPVAGVSVDPAVVAACNVKKAQHQAKKNQTAPAPASSTVK